MPFGFEEDTSCSFTVASLYIAECEQVSSCDYQIIMIMKMYDYYRVQRAIARPLFSLCEIFYGIHNN